MVLNHKLDVMVLISGDNDFQTLPQTLERWGCKIMLVCWDINSTIRKANGELSQTMTGWRLLENTHYPIKMYEEIERGLQKNDPTILGLFGRKTPEVKVSERASRDFVGQITSLHKREGVVQIEGGEKMKFYANDEELGVDFGELKKGVRVKFRKKEVGGKKVAFDLQYTT